MNKSKARKTLSCGRAIYSNDGRVIVVEPKSVKRNAYSTFPTLPDPSTNGSRIFPALDTLAKLCKYLDVSADYILGLEEY